VLPKKTFLGVLVAAACVAASGPLQAADVWKKWRVSFSAGGYNPQDEIQSSASNQLILLNPCARTNTCTEDDVSPGSGLVTGAFQDPRNQSAVFNNLDINSGYLGTLAVQYGFAKTGMATFVVEGSVGYGKSDVGDVEVQAWFLGNNLTLEEQQDLGRPYNFVFVEVPAGEMTSIPFQLSVLARFRPRATFNPYAGLGLGYSVIGFDVDPALNEVSRNMDASRGVQTRIDDIVVVQGNLGVPKTDGLPQLDLAGATVDARDTFTWHLAGGMELTLGKRMAVFLDVRWVDASRSLSIGFNGDNELGRSVPQYTDFDDTILAQTRYGPVLIGSCPDPTEDGVSCTGGGLLDIGQAIPIPEEGAPSGLDCFADPSNTQCTVGFAFKDEFEELGVEDDGQLDPGYYYATGGSVDYDGFTAQFGVRFTF
jgi:hypothetical protein